jgi:sulfur carrier protein ThiS
MITVRVWEQGGVKEEVELAADSTVMDALKKAGARTDVTKEIRVNNEPADKEDIVENGDTVYVVPNIAGN